MVVLSNSLASLGAGALKPRDDAKLLGTPKESTLLKEGNSFYKTFAIECSRATVSVDMFLFGNAYQDVASLCASFYLQHVACSLTYLHSLLATLHIGLDVLLPWFQRGTA